MNQLKLYVSKIVIDGRVVDSIINCAGSAEECAAAARRFWSHGGEVTSVESRELTEAEAAIVRGGWRVNF